MRKLLAVSLMLVMTGCATSNGLFGEGPSLGQGFGARHSAHVGGGSHNGLDINVPLRTPVVSPADGKVTFSRSLNISLGSPPTVTIDHGNGISTSYIHIDRVRVKEGDFVKQGQVIAETAMTGPAGPSNTVPVQYPHLHFVLMRGGMYADPASLNMQCPKDKPKFIWPAGC